MKTILICPNQASGLTVLADSKPLPILPLLGEAFLCYWMQHLAAERFTEVRIVTSDPAELIAEHTGDGSRWGIKVEVIHEIRDLQPDEARKRYKPAYETDWAPQPLDVIEASHLPGLPDQKLFASYEAWFHTLSLWLPLIGSGKRIGVRELAPGIWTGRRTKISPSAQLVAPCWIGDHVQIGKNARIGPGAFLENEVVVEAGCVISNSWMGPETFLGALTELSDSLAWGDLLINWKTGSHTIVPDPFLMTALSDRKDREEFTGSPAKIPQTSLARRFGNVISLAQKFQS